MPSAMTYAPVWAANAVIAASTARAPASWRASTTTVRSIFTKSGRTRRSISSPELPAPTSSSAIRSPAARRCWMLRRTGSMRPPTRSVTSMTTCEASSGERSTASASHVSPSESRSSVCGREVDEEDGAAGQLHGALQRARDAQGVELVDAARALRDVERLRRAGETVLRRDPRERLDGEEVAGREVPDGLVVAREVAIARTMVQGGRTVGRDGDELADRIGDGGRPGTGRGLEGDLDVGAQRVRVLPGLQRPGRGAQRHAGTGEAMDEAVGDLDGAVEPRAGQHDGEGAGRGAEGAVAEAAVAEDARDAGVHRPGDPRVRTQEDEGEGLDVARRVSRGARELAVQRVAGGEPVGAPAARDERARHQRARRAGTGGPTRRRPDPT